MAIINQEMGEYTDSPLQCGNRVNVGADPCVCPNMRHKETSAFTAIELMIVLAIMGIMLVAAAPSFVQFTRNSRIKSGAQMVVSALRTARSHAIKRRKRCMVLFNFNPDTHNLGYAVKIYWDPGPHLGTPHYPEGGSVTNWKALPKTIIMTDGTSGLSTRNIPFPNDSDVSSPEDIKYIYFTPTGSASKGADEVIKISDETHEDTSLIGIIQITGRIKTSRE